MKLNYCLLFHFYLFLVLLFCHYINAKLLTYQRFWHIKINLLSVLIYLIKLSLRKFQVCYNFISVLVLKIVIECPEEIFKKLLSVTIYMKILENTFLKSQIYDKLVTMLLSYPFSVTKGLFQLLPMQAFLYN